MPNGHNQQGFYEIACKGDGCLWHLTADSVGGAGSIFRIQAYTVYEVSLIITSIR